MAKLVTNVFIVGAKRTAFGAYGRSLKNFSPVDLGTIASEGALKSSGVDSTQVDHVIFGNVVQTDGEAIYLARHIGLRSRIPAKTPALTINRLCGSGFEAISLGCQQIACGRSKIVVAGGTESMSGPPYIVRDIRFKTPYGKTFDFEDYLWQCFTDFGIKTPMGGTAENLATLYKITREQADEYSRRSQHRWHESNKAGYFRSEIEPIKLKTREGGERIFDTDEHPRETTLEKLAKLPTVFKKGGIVTAGNASGLCDGAAAVVLADESSTCDQDLKPLARVVAWSTVGCEPSIMGIGPVDAIRNLVKITGVSLDKAFATQVIAVKRDLGLDTDDERVNANGGAIALGHPLAASGTRIAGHLVYELRRKNARYGIGTACIGGGQGIALLFERV